MKILITRAQAAAKQTAEYLKQAGHDPIIMPIFEIKDTKQQVPEKLYDGIIFTSKNAVEILQARNWQHQDMSIPAFCVGEKTKKAALALGFTKVFSANGGGLALTKLIEEMALNSKTFLYPSTPDKSFDMAKALSLISITVETVDIYQAKAIAPTKENFEAAIAEITDNYVFTYSALSSDHLNNLLKKFNLASSLKRITLVGISEQAIKPLEQLNWKSVAISKKPNETNMLEQLD